MERTITPHGTLTYHEVQLMGCCGIRELYLKQKRRSPAQGRAYDSPKDVPRSYPNGGELHSSSSSQTSNQCSWSLKVSCHARDLTKGPLSFPADVVLQLLLQHGAHLQTRLQPAQYDCNAGGCKMSRPCSSRAHARCEVGPHEVEDAKPEGFLGRRGHIIDEGIAEGDDGGLSGAHDYPAQDENPESGRECTAHRAQHPHCKPKPCRDATCQHGMRWEASRLGHMHKDCCNSNSSGSSCILVADVPSNEQHSYGSADRKICKTADQIFDLPIMRKAL